MSYSSLPFRGEDFTAYRLLRYTLNLHNTTFSLNCQGFFYCNSFKLELQLRRTLFCITLSRRLEEQSLLFLAEPPAERNQRVTITNPRLKSLQKLLEFCGEKAYNAEWRGDKLPCLASFPSPNI